jgi:predicted ester cyclase
MRDVVDLDANKAVVRRILEDFWGNGDLTAAELYHPAMVDHSPLPGQLPGRQGMIDQCRLFHDAFAITLTIEALFAEDDLVCDRWTAVLTHIGPFLGVEPTGRSATVHAIDVMRVREGLIVEAWHQEDMHVALSALGVLP